ncbi:MAG: cytochrome c biogenesis protein CcdA, partial [Candidatus Binatia bacterium]
MRQGEAAVRRLCYLDRKMRALFGLLIALVASAASAAEDDPPAPEEIVRMQVDSAGFSPSAGTLDVEMKLEIADGWHINAHRPTSKELIPTTLTVEPPKDFEVREIRYPVPRSMPFEFAGGKTLAVYSGTIRIGIPLIAGQSFGPEGVSFLSKLRYQACDDTRCLRPVEIERTFVIKSPPGAAVRAAVSAAGATPVERWLADYGLLPTLALVLVMGLGLNLTPCVYPLISVTLAYFGGQARERRGRVVALASVYALGVALTFSALGVIAALSGGLFGAMLQKPATLVAIASLLVLLALSNFGLYSLQPPSWLLQKVGAASVGMTGALFMGLTMGVVAAPCVGPIVVGLLVAVGALGDPALGFALFFALAAGLGLPYVALGTFAGSLARLPRSGEWLVWIEHLFGFLLLGLALFFVSPLLPDDALAWLVPIFVAGSGITLGFLDSHGNRLRLFAAGKQAFAVAAILLALWLALPSSARSGISWSAFSEAALAEARAEGRPAVVDFRADWCLPCVEMEHTTFADPEVKRRAGSFAMLQADVTAMSAENEDLLSRYEVLGVPTTIFYDRQGREHRRVVGYIRSEEF